VAQSQIGCRTLRFFKGAGFDLASFSNGKYGNMDGNMGTEIWGQTGRSPMFLSSHENEDSRKRPVCPRVSLKLMRNCNQLYGLAHMCAPSEQDLSFRVLGGGL
jgi:hypothetical protein